MITLSEIRKLIEKSENPLIFYDDDPDGLVSFLLVKKHFKKGNGVAVRGKPMLGVDYLLSVNRYNPDLIVVLDKPMIEQDFVDKIKVPIVWIDHHPIVNIKGVKYYNPRFRDKNDNRCVSYWCYKLTNDNMWLATIGIVADYQKPSFIKQFIKKYPDLLKEFKDQKEVMFNSRLGELIKLFGYALKGRTSDVNANINYLIKIENPYVLLNDDDYARKIKNIRREYEKLLTSAVNQNKGNKIIVYIYPTGNFSFSGELSNELMYKFQGKVVIVGRKKDRDVRLSLRAPEEKKIKLPKILEKALIGVEGYGGGHDYACGASIKEEYLDQFINVIKTEVLKC